MSYNKNVDTSIQITVTSREVWYGVEINGASYSLHESYDVNTDYKEYEMIDGEGKTVEVPKEVLKRITTLSWILSDSLKGM